MVSQSNPTLPDVLAVENAREALSTQGASIDIYIDGELGDDNNTGTSTTNAFRTWSGFERLRPMTTLLDAASVRVWFAGSAGAAVVAGVTVSVPGFGANATGIQTYEISNMRFPCVGSYKNAFSYRGAHMVPFAMATGPASKVVSSTAGLWIKVDTDAAEGRARTASVDSPGAGYTLWGTRLLTTGTSWTADDAQGWFLRVTRGAVKVIFEVPCAGNGANHVDIDFADLPDGGTKLQDMILAGDVVEVVRPSVRLRSDPGLGSLGSISATGGGTYGTYDSGAGFSDRGGPNGWPVERIELAGAVNFSGVYGYGFDRCVLTDGDTNLRGGGGQFVNFSVVGPTGGQSTATGIQFQGSFSTLHDTAGCRPDSASDPIYQDVDSPMVEWQACKGALVTGGNGGGYSGGIGFSYTQERNISIYGALGAVAFKMYGGRFIQPAAASVRNRRLLLQGSGNAGLGVKLAVQSFVKLCNNQCRLFGAGFDDVGLGTTTKTWLEAQTFVNADAGSAAGHWVQAFSGSILTNADP